jgi:hypothetical protein
VKGQLAPKRSVGVEANNSSWHLLPESGSTGYAGDQLGMSLWEALTRYSSRFQCPSSSSG